MRYRGQMSGERYFEPALVAAQCWLPQQGRTLYNTSIAN
jgi:hypothetical protein